MSVGTAETLQLPSTESPSQTAAAVLHGGQQDLDAHVDGDTDPDQEAEDTGRLRDLRKMTVTSQYIQSSMIAD